MTARVKYIMFLLFLTVTGLTAGTKYGVYFTDKNGSFFDLYGYFDPAAIESHINKGNDLLDSSNFPVPAKYTSIVEQMSSGITSESRWLNAVVVRCSPKQAEAISQLPFVKEVEPIRSTAKLARYKFKSSLKQDSYAILSNQLSGMQGERFDRLGIDGKGVRIAIFDAGFSGADKSPVFEHLRKNGQIIKTYDFVRDNENVYGYNAHGTMVLACLAGIIDGEKIGLATGAEYLLARTESNMETLSEEENWMRALEWAYQNGAQIINSSLGYTYHRYFEADMDGKTSLVSRAAAMAASKGIMVVNAMGNDGQSRWQYMGAPADVETVMAVGGINPNTGMHIPFSSFGPTADKRMKPNVSAYAHVVTGSKNKMAEAFGTSFAAPLVAGFAACVLQVRPELSTQELFSEIEKSGSLYPYYDYAHGYGIPQAGYFTDDKMQPGTTFELNHSDNSVLITVLNENEKGLLYYHIGQKNGVLEKYSVVQLSRHDVLELPLEDLSGKVLMVHYKGFTFEETF